METKFAFSLRAEVPERETMAKMTALNIENPKQNESLLHRGPLASEGGTLMISTMEKVLETPEKTTTVPLNTPSPRAKKLALMMKRNESGFENGYDSDGQMGPSNNMEVVKGPQDFDEVDHSERIEVPQSASKSNGDSDAERNNEAIALSEKDDGPGQHMLITELDKKSKKDLQDELRKRGLKVGGKKGNCRNTSERP